MIITQFAERLTYQRKLKGFSQEQLADRTKVTVRTIQRIAVYWLSDAVS